MTNMKFNSKTNDYLNLLEDSLKLGHLQVEKIYHRLLNLDSDKYINIRTCYPMKYRKDSDYVFFKGKYRICWNSEGIRDEYNPRIIESILKKYEEWLTDYERNSDNQRIKEKIQKERRLALRESAMNERKHEESKVREDYKGKYPIMKLRFDIFRPMNFNFRNYFIKNKQLIRHSIEEKEYAYDYDESDTSINSFICRDDEIEWEEDTSLKKSQMKHRRNIRKIKQDIVIYLKDDSEEILDIDQNDDPKNSMLFDDVFVDMNDEYDLV